MAGFDILQAIAALIPGEQPFLGEQKGETGLLAALGQALGALTPGIQTALGEGVPGIPAGAIVKRWSTGTAVFYKLADGRIAAQRKDGSFRIYRPKKHIVVSSNPRVGTLLRADARLDKLVKGLSKSVNKHTKKSPARKVNITSGDAAAIAQVIRALPAGRG